MNNTLEKIIMAKRNIPSLKEEETTTYIVKADYDIMARLEQLEKENAELKSENNVKDSKISELESLVENDPNTGLVRKEHLFEKFKEMYISETRTVEKTGKDQSIAYILSDIDDFTSKNTTYGHHEMDNVLKDVGEILLNNTRKGHDVVVRDGGEETVTLLKETGISGAYNFIDKMQKIINNYDPITYKQKDSNIRAFKQGDYLSMSMGLSVVEITKQNVEDMNAIYNKHRNSDKNILNQEINNYIMPKFQMVAARADNATYHSKFKGKNQCNEFDAEIDYNTIRNLYDLQKQGKISELDYSSQGGVINSKVA